MKTNKDVVWASEWYGRIVDACKKEDIPKIAELSSEMMARYLDDVGDRSEDPELKVECALMVACLKAAFENESAPIDR